MQRREDGSTDFYRNWFNYTNGFENLCKEFYWGNQNLKTLFSSPWNLRVELYVKSNPFLGISVDLKYREYDEFRIDKANFHMQVTDGGTGTTGEIIRLYHIGNICKT